MPTYQYQVLKTKQIVEVEQRITEPAHEVLEVDGEMLRVKRVIAAAPAAFLVDGPSGGWASTGYSKRPHERQAEAVLGRKLHKAAR